MGITLEGIQKSFSGVPVIRNASFALPDQGAVCFFGPSGCGKTTLLRIISGLEAPDGGSISGTKSLRFACHFQEDRLLPWYTAKENIALTHGGDGALAASWLARADLLSAANLYPHELSGGMRRRVSLLRALAFDSDVLLLDEPVRELDEAAKAQMLDLINQSLDDRLLLLVTHDRSQADTLGCKLIHMPL